MNGEIQINVTNSNGTRFYRHSNESLYIRKSRTNLLEQAAAPVKATAAPAPKAVNTPVDQDTEAYFNQAVTKALKANDVNKAMNLVNEAEKLGLTSPRQTFLKQVSSK